MWTFLKEINKEGTTIILTTHYLEEAENLCRNIAIINHGKLVENTSMKKLLRTLNMETFVLDLGKPIKEVPTLPEHKVNLLDDTTLEVEVSKGIGINPIFTELSNRNITVTSMRNKSNRLEQLFLHLVENGLDDRHTQQ